MIIQFILSFVFLILVVYGLNQKSKSKGVGAFIYATAILGCFFVWFPDYATVVGHLVGVGRGTDLVLYIFVVVSMVVGFSLYLKLNTCLMLITELARHTALATPILPGGQAVPPARESTRLDSVA